MLVVLDPPRVVWASAEAANLFGSSDLHALTRLVFGRAGQARPMTTRLARLTKGQGQHFERLSVTTRFRRYGLLLACVPVPDTSMPTVLMRTLDDVEVEPAALGTDTKNLVFDDGPAQELPDPVVLDSPPFVAVPTIDEIGRTVAADPTPDELVGRNILRFVWRSDRGGRISAVGAEMAAALGDATLRIGDDLIERLSGVDAEAASIAERAIDEGRGWSGLMFRWPSEESGPPAELEIGGTPSVADGGYRGYGVLRFAPVPQPEPAQDFDSADNGSPQDRDEPSTALTGAAADTDLLTAGMDVENNPDVDDHPSMMPDDTPTQIDASNEPLSNIETTEDAAKPGNADEVAPVYREGSVARLAESTVPPPARSGEVSFATSGTSKVVHLANFKAGVPALSGKATSRREPPRPVQPDESEPLDVPSWAEAPREVSTPDQRLSNHERFNFDEIARALAALPVGEAAGAARLSGSAEHADVTPLPSARVDTPAQTHQAPEPDFTKALLEALPLGVLVSQGDAAVYANRALLGLADCRSLAEFATLGGLDRVLQATGSDSQDSASRRYELTGDKGRKIVVEGHVQTIVWRNAPATLVSLRQASDEQGSTHAPAKGPDLRTARASIADLQTALDLAASGAGFLDGQGRILSISHGAERLFGFDGHEIVGDACTTLVAAEDQDAWRAFFNGFMAASGQGRTSAYRKFIGRKRSNAPVPVAVSLRLVEPNKICIVWQAGQNGYASESELDALRRAAERSSDMKSEFLAKVSHEIRTPLNAILGFAEIIIEERFGPVANERYREYLKDIHTSGTHVVSLVNDLLDLSRIEANGLDLDANPVNVNVVLGECVGTIQGQAHRDRIIVRSSFAASSALAIVDERALRQIVLNLLSNAVKFNEPGGQVIVSSGISEGGQVVVRVRDTGPGMSESEIETAMKPFRQLATSKAGAGTGLGLPLTKAMVEASHGTLKIKSKPGEGTLAEVMLQRAPELPVSVPAE